VLAHELGHLQHGDSAVMTVASAPRLMGAALLGIVQDTDNSPVFLWFFIWPFLLIPIAIGTLCTLALSRYREYAADRASAILTGHPESLMSALAKLDGITPIGDLRMASPLCIVSSARRSELLMEHPPLAKRIHALSQLARDLGSVRPKMRLAR
jgi:heat shock protein HtpX